MDSKLRINWLNIILNPEFQNSLDFESLKETSLMCKLVREKLNPILFKHVKVSTKDFNAIFKGKRNIIIDYFKSRVHSGTNNNKSSDAKELSIEDAFNDIKGALNGIKSYTKTFYLTKVRRAGYYLFPVVNIFDNLASLKLEDCIFAYSVFSKLGELLPNLTRVELVDVAFAKKPDDSSSINDIVLPESLTSLAINECEIYITDMLSNTYEFLFSENRRYISVSDFSLPKISVPSLKELMYYADEEESDSGLDAFLELNPNIESLDIVYFISDQLASLRNLISLGLYGKIVFDRNADLPSLDSLKHLKLLIDDDNTYDDIKRVCSLCPNLEVLSFYIEDYDEFYDIEDIADIDNFDELVNYFIVPIISRLFKLKTLKIEFGNSDNDSIGGSSDDDDLDNISNLEEDLDNISGDEEAWATSDDENRESYMDEDSLELDDIDENMEIDTDEDDMEIDSDVGSLENISDYENLEIVSNEESPENRIDSNDQQTSTIEENIDLTQYSQIEKLVFKLDSESIYKIKFENYKYLKQFEVTSTTDKINTDAFREKFNGYEGWRFKFGEYKISGFRKL
jgi:hypothetical protein